MPAETTFPAMGTTGHILIDGPNPDALLQTARQRLIELEERWTRFCPGSEVNQLNAKTGHPVIVSADTYRLIATAVTAWHQTNGRYDPTLLDAITALGYDRTFDSIDHATTPVAPSNRPPHGPTPSDIDLHPGINAVTLPSGIGIDPGGIGKGLAGDIVTEELLTAGATGVMVNLGGDIRVAGTPPGTEQWPISVTDPADPNTEILRIQIADGAVATSSRLKRHWTNTHGDQIHHLLDPATGHPIDNNIATVTVIAGEGWWAEALTKALFIAGTDGLDRLTNASGLIIDLDGNRHPTPDLIPALR